MEKLFLNDKSGLVIIQACASNLLHGNEATVIGIGCGVDVLNNEIVFILDKINLYKTKLTDNLNH